MQFDDYVVRLFRMRSRIASPSPFTSHMDAAKVYGGVHEECCGQSPRSGRAAVRRATFPESLSILRVIIIFIRLSYIDKGIGLER